MEYLLNSSQMKQCDTNTIEYYGIPSIVLMERAALALSDEIKNLFPTEGTKILSVCGTGNNGGDGIAAARLLFLAGYDVDILIPGNRDKFSTQASVQYNAAVKYNIPVYSELPDKNYTVVIDALLGIGLDREIRESMAELIDRLNEMDCFRAAADIASGVSADTGQVLGTAFKADMTVTFGFAKTGHILDPGRGYTGRLVVSDIGIDKKSLLNISPSVFLTLEEDLSLLPVRKDHSNKSTYGKLLIMAGSCNMAGAAVFASKAAFFTGSGMVKVATAEENRLIIQEKVPEAILSTYCDPAGPEDDVRQLLPWADAAVIGPGLGTGEKARRAVKALLETADIPCVIDADALNIISADPECLSLSHSPVVITPHIGEMSRLCGLSPEEIQKDPVGCARTFAAEHNVITVLKDAVTVTALPTGEAYINNHGNDGMATAGSGDVLSGIIGSLMGQGMKPEEAAYTGVLLHAMAGDEAARKKGRRSLTASDIAENICEVYKKHGL